MIHVNYYKLYLKGVHFLMCTKFLLAPPPKKKFHNKKQEILRDFTNASNIISTAKPRNRCINIR